MLPKKEFYETMLSLISLNDPLDRTVLLRCGNTLSYIHGQSGSYDTKDWKYYIINLRFSKRQQIFRPRIILLIQVIRKTCILEKKRNINWAPSGFEPTPTTTTPLSHKETPALPVTPLRSPKRSFMKQC